jgi:ABC-type phosphate transport system substrate-binding protein
VGRRGATAARAGLSRAVAATAGSIPSSPAAARESLSETGSTLLFPLMGAWAAAYHRQYPNVSIATAGTGSGAGISHASDGTVDIGASDAYLSSGDLVKDPTVLNVPLAISAQQVNYNLPDLPASVHLKLDGSVLAQMYEGKIGQYVLPTAATIGAAVASFVSATPSNETISMVDGPAAAGYPTVNYEYAIVNASQPSATRARDIKAFLHWAITTGNAAQYLDQVRFQPLRRPRCSTRPTAPRLDRPRRLPTRSWPGCRCLRWTAPTRRPGTWPR